MATWIIRTASEIRGWEDNMSKNNVKILVDGDILGQKGGHSEGPGILCPAEVESGSLNVLGFVTDDLAVMNQTVT